MRLVGNILVKSGLDMAAEMATSILFQMSPEYWTLGGGAVEEPTSSFPRESVGYSPADTSLIPYACSLTILRGTCPTHAEIGVQNGINLALTRRRGRWPRSSPHPPRSATMTSRWAGGGRCVAGSHSFKAEGSKGGPGLCFALYRAVGGVWELS